MKKIIVNVPLEGEYFTTVRLTTGGLCALAEFDADSAEDYKVCVTESLLILKRNGFLRAKIVFEVGEALACVIEGEEKSGEIEDGFEDEISYALLNALLGKVDFEKDESGRAIKVAFAA